MHTDLLEAHGNEEHPDHILNVKAVIEVRYDKEHGVILEVFEKLSLIETSHLTL